MLSAELRHLIGLGTSLGKLFLKESLNEGLRFIGSLSAPKLHLQGRWESPEHPFCRIHCALMSPVCSTTNVYRAGDAPGTVVGPGNTAVNKTVKILNQRQFAEMKILLESLGTS